MNNLAEATARQKYLSFGYSIKLLHPNVSSVHMSAPALSVKKDHYNEYWQPHTVLTVKGD